jgi:hypothetical protein
MTSDRGRWEMFPLMAPEMVEARVEELRRVGGAKARRAGTARAGRSAGLRSALGVRLVSLGCRLLGEPVRIERPEVR